MARFLAWHQVRAFTWKKVPTVWILVLLVGTKGALISRCSFSSPYQERKALKVPSKGSGLLAGKRAVARAEEERAKLSKEPTMLHLEWRCHRLSLDLA